MERLSSQRHGSIKNAVHHRNSANAINMNLVGFAEQEIAARWRGDHHAYSVYVQADIVALVVNPTNEGAVHRLSLLVPARLSALGCDLGTLLGCQRGGAGHPAFTP